MAKVKFVKKGTGKPTGKKVKFAKKFKGRTPNTALAYGNTKSR